MQCFHPWKPTAAMGLPPTLTLRCGQCQGCRLERARQWAVRCLHEAQLHEENCFLTLTYDDQRTAPGASLVHRDFQLFMKRLRRHFQKKTIRYYMCGEYGEQFERPHFHACLFGTDFADKYPWRKNQSGHQLYRSATLELLWKHGNSEVGAVTFQSAAYVARYVMKKITGDLATSHYTYLDEHGELHSRTPEYNRMSLRQAIGKGWYEKFKNDVYPQDHVITNGHPAPPPRYYDKLYKIEHPAALKTIQKKRNARAIANLKDNSPRRLKAKEQVQAARAALLKRTIT